MDIKRTPRPPFKLISHDMYFLVEVSSGYCISTLTQWHAIKQILPWKRPSLV